MTDATSTPPPAREPDLGLSCALPAPITAVFAAWTDADLLRRWMGPVQLEVLRASMDLRPGGIYHYGMRAPDGNEMWGRWEILEVSPPTRLVYVQSFSDAQGAVTRHPLVPSWPAEIVTTLELRDGGSECGLHLHWKPRNASEAEVRAFRAALPGARGAWELSFRRLAALLAQPAPAGAARSA